MILKGQKDKVERKVTVTKRTDGDKKTKVEFYLICHTMGVEKQKDFSDRLHSASGVGDVELIKDYTDGWKGLKDAEDQDVEYNDENLEIVMDDRDYREAMVGTVFEAIFGKKIDFSVKN